MNINLTLIGQAISFGIFVWFCVKFVWPPLISALEERASTIAEGLAAGEKGQEKLLNAEKEVEKLLTEAKDNAQTFITNAQKRADEIIESAKADAREEAEKIRINAEAEIEQEKNAAREGLRGEIAGLVLNGAETILMKEVDQKTHQSYLEELSERL
ncbi:MAG: F0F1 ATP synthase subunit B [Pseudomonadota bacterium]|nr:F0F1 ATP synthase subunit B [Pseudomonadota bacterium]